MIVKYYVIYVAGWGDEMPHYEIGGSLEGYISENSNDNFITFV